MKGIEKAAVALTLFAMLAWAAPAGAYEWSVDVSVSPSTFVPEGTPLTIKCIWSRSGKTGMVGLATGRIRGMFNGQWFDIREFPSLNLGGSEGAFSAEWIPQRTGRYAVGCGLLVVPSGHASREVEVLVRPREAPHSFGSPPAARPEGAQTPTPPKSVSPPTSAVPVQPRLKALGHRVVKGDLETVLAFSKDGDGTATIRTKTEPQMASGDVVVSGRSGTATVRVRDACTVRAGSTLHLVHELLAISAFPGGGSVTLPLGRVEQRMPLSELCRPRVPASKSEGGQGKAR